MNKQSSNLNSSLGRSQKSSKLKSTAYEILKRENLASKRSRLECLLIQQMTTKYGSKKIDSQLNCDIKFEIQKFLSSFDDVFDAENHLQQLEDKLQSLRLKKTKQFEVAASITSNNQEKLKEISSETSLGLSSAQNIMTSNAINTKSWVVFNAIIDISEEEKQQNSKLMKMRKQESFKRALDEQMNFLENRKAEEQHNKSVTHDYLQTEEEKLKREEEANRKKKNDNYRLERELKLSQISLNKQLKEKERHQRIHDEVEEINRNKLFLQSEEEMRQMKKQMEKVRQDGIIVENEKNKAIKAEIIRQQREFDIKLSHDYEEKLRKEEECRVSAFQNRVKALQQSSQNYDMIAGSQIRKREQDELERISVAVELKNRQDRERERQKEEMRKSEIQKSIEFNRKLIEDKKQNDLNEKEAAVRRRKMMELELEMMKQRELEKKAEKNTKMNEIKNVLDKQIEQRKEAERQYSSLNGIELDLNKSLLRKMQEDPELQRKVYEKILPQTKFQQSTFKFA